MKLKEEYTTQEKLNEIEKNEDISDTEKLKEAKKTVISNDAFAIGQLLEEISLLLNKLRTKEW